MCLNVGPAYDCIPTTCIENRVTKKKRCVKYSPKVQTELQKIELTLSNIHPKFNT